MNRLTLTVLCMVLCSAMAFAQSEDVLRPNGRPDGGEGSATSSSSKKKLPWILGLEAGMNVNFYNGSLQGTLENSPYNAFQSGSGFSPFFGLYFEVPLSKSISIGMRALYDMKSFGNSVENAEQECQDFISGQFNVALLTLEYDEKINYVTLNPLVRWESTSGFFVQLGPVIQFAVDSVNSTVTRTINEDETCRFNFGTPDESRVQTIESTGEASNPTRFGVDLGVGYRMALSSTIDLVPRIGYQWMLTPYGDDTAGIDDSQANIPGVGPESFTYTDITLSSLQLSLSLWFHL